MSLQDKLKDMPEDSVQTEQPQGSLPTLWLLRKFSNLSISECEETCISAGNYFYENQ